MDLLLVRSVHLRWLRPLYGYTNSFVSSVYVDLYSGVHFHYPLLWFLLYSRPVPSGIDGNFLHPKIRLFSSLTYSPKLVSSLYRTVRRHCSPLCTELNRTENYSKKTETQCCLTSLVHVCGPLDTLRRPHWGLLVLRPRLLRPRHLYRGIETLSLYCLRLIYKFHLGYVKRLSNLTSHSLSLLDFYWSSKIWKTFLPYKLSLPFPMSTSCKHPFPVLKVKPVQPKLYKYLYNSIQTSTHFLDSTSILKPSP